MQITQDILEKINQYDTIILHRHMNPDPDAIGSQVGLKEIIQTNFPDKRVLATGFNEPTLAWMASMDTVTDEDYEGALVIVCDTANTPRIDDKRYTSGNFLIKIDHHPNDDAYGDFLWVDTDSSSTSELITLFALEQQLEISPEAARLLYAGIVGDTGRFLYPSTTSRTFEMVAHLRSFDFDFAGLSRQMDSMSSKIAKLQGYVYDNLEIDENGASRVTLTQELLKHYQITDAEYRKIISEFEDQDEDAEAFGLMGLYPSSRSKSVEFSTEDGDSITFGTKAVNESEEAEAINESEAPKVNRFLKVPSYMI